MGEHVDVVASYGLPAELPPDVGTARLVDLMRLEKKATDGLSFVLDGPAGAELVRDVPLSVVLETLRAMPVAAQ